ncbi:MAG TPA: sigma-70 family RNA polymerase sigma factor [Thermoanaerobaculia bacterium]|nr:sigma-70 family RNA polymerase sigma factor [Thermoanaerobaculia bacterium]
MERERMSASAVLSHDLELAERHRYGDGDAFAEVYRSYETPVYNLALRMAGDPEEARDLTQEVFLRVFRHLGKFRGRSSLKTWIYRVAINHCRSRLGRRRLPQSSLTGPEGDAGRDLPDPNRGPEERAVARDERRVLEEALAALPVAFREAVVLRDIEGLAYDEIAQVLGVRPGTVRSRIARGREHLRRALEPGPPAAPQAPPEVL